MNISFNNSFVADSCVTDSFVTHSKCLIQSQYALTCEKNSSVTDSKLQIQMTHSDSFLMTLSDSFHIQGLIHDRFVRDTFRFVHDAEEECWQLLHMYAY